MNCPKCQAEISDQLLAAHLGSKGGRSKTARKISASRRNGSRGGRPPIKTISAYVNQDAGCDQCWSELAHDTPELIHKLARDAFAGVRIPVPLFHKFQTCPHGISVGIFVSHREVS